MYIEASRGVLPLACRSVKRTGLLVRRDRARLGGGFGRRDLLPNLRFFREAGRGRLPSSDLLQDIPVERQQLAAAVANERAWSLATLPPDVTDVRFRGRSRLG